jgi:hypothetical protein
VLAFMSFPKDHRPKIHSTDMDKHFFCEPAALWKSLELHSSVRPGGRSFFRPGHRSDSRRAQGQPRQLRLSVVG